MRRVLQVMLAVVVHQASLAVPAGAETGDSAREWFSPSWGPATTPTLSEGQKRRILRPYVVLSSDCIARNALLQPDILEAYRALNLQAPIAAAWRLCGNELAQVAAEHDRLHGAGTGLVFLRGPYNDDLPRAVRVRIKEEVERRIIAQDTAEAEKRAEAARAEARKREEVAQAENNAIAARDRAYACTGAELRKLVGSAETADNLTTAAMTLCRREVADAVDSRADALQAKAGGLLGDAYLRTVREDLRRTVRDNVLTNAVQIKASAAVALPASPRAVPPAPLPGQPIPASGPTGPAPPPVTSAAVPGPGKAGTALSECLALTNTAQHGQLVNREALIKTMIELCRPEIETEARRAFLADTSVPLDGRREAALASATKAASDIADGRAP